MFQTIIKYFLLSFTVRVFPRCSTMKCSVTCKSFVMCYLVLSTIIQCLF